ncbi:hypothetical protein Pla22_38050 [Rubripirellula amarantea]|uniref:Uncharacterized protein n=1 Tax=Rubripirellula amarantea TaxID=2527999 RepID=A0A5C5WLL9_9BACT|nr:hypothetical protein [Rubripirellula amarantea]TWT51029.1 hypothetical protein Pla22_38050 [Rubripirellula amarantea]
MFFEPLILPTTDPFDRHAKEHPFVASVVSSGWVLFRTHAPLLLLFGIPLIAIQTDAVWDNFPLGKGATTPGPWERSVMSYILLALIGMSLVEALLNTIRLALDPTAIVITDEGVQGYHAWLRRSFKWCDVSHVRRSGNRLLIHKRATSSLLQEWNRHSRPGGRYHWSKLLVVELNCVDQSADSIFSEISRHWKPS